MREIFAGVPTVWQRCASAINSCQPGADKQRLMGAATRIQAACGARAER